jgi:hypothetical protein
LFRRLVSFTGLSQLTLQLLILIFFSSSLFCVLLVLVLILNLVLVLVQNPQLNGRICCWYADNTCCGGPFLDPSIVDLLLNVTELALETLITVFGSPNNCYYNIADLSCNMCSPDTTFTSLRDDSRRICTSYCNSLYTNCSPYASLFNIPSTVTNPTEVFF